MQKIEKYLKILVLCEVVKALVMLIKELRRKFYVAVDDEEY